MNASDARARVFFGLPVDADLGERIAPLSHQVAAAAGGRPVPRENLHATLAFIGSVPRDDVARLLAIGGSLTVERFAVELDRVGSFRGARVAWLGASHVPPQLQKLHATLGSALAAQGFPVEERAYHPHVTLARHCRHTFKETAVASYTWVVRAVALYESVSSEGGPRYLALAEWSPARD